MADGTVQGKGSASRIVVDFEAGFNTPKTTNRTGKIIPFISCDITPSRNLNTSNEIRGNRNASAPYVGNKNVSGSLVVPIRADSFGWFMKAALGAPTFLEKPLPAASSGSDIKTGSPTITIAAAGAYTLSVAQTPTLLAVGDRIIYEKDGVRYVGYVTTYTNTTTGVLQTKRAAGAACAEITDATVIAVCQNKADATPGTVAIATGTATFSATHANLAVGQLLIYDAAAPKLARIAAVPTATTATVKALDGSVPADATGKTVEWLGIMSYWTSTFKTHATASLPSFVLEMAYLDLDTPYYELFTGCKIDKVEIKIGGDGELTASLSIIGADMATDHATAYDSAATALGGTKMQMFQASATEGGTACTILREFSLSFANDLDGDQYCIAGGGVRDSIPEGNATPSGSLSALFKGDSLLAKADGETESSLELTINPSDETLLTITLPEVIYAQTGPTIPNPKGIVLDLKFSGYYDNSTDASAMVVTLTNQTGAY